MPVAKLRWLGYSDTEEYYRIYRSEATIDTTNLPTVYAELPANSTEYDDTAIEVGKIYHYIVSCGKGTIEKFSSEMIFDSTLPLLGPGMQTLIGNNDTVGYFGEVVASSDFIIYTDLSTLLSFTAGTAIGNGNWLKFVIDKKIIFISKIPVRYGLSWDQLNAANLIDGSRIVSILGYDFKIRLPLGADTNPAPTIPQNTSDPIGTQNSEWSRLLYPVVDDTAITSYTGPKWAAFTSADLNTVNGYWSWCQEIYSPTPTSRVLRGSRASISYLTTGASSGTGAAFGWRPMLEMVNA